MDLAPVAIFCYKRKDHLVRVVESLLLNKEASECRVIFFSDGPRDSGDLEEIRELRRYLESLSGFKSITLILRDKNIGLAESIISGIDSVFKENDKVIVLEDDIVVSPFFVSYMNRMLKMYEYSEKVASIHGYVYPVAGELPETFFIRGADCWGWATWKRSWNIFERNGQLLLQKLKDQKLTSKFDFDNSFPFTEMLANQIKGKNNSWAIRWNASAFLEEMYTLYPYKSLVQNIGFDNTGTHCSEVSYFDVEILSEEFLPKKIKVGEDRLAYELFVKYFKSIQPGIIARVGNRIKRALRV